jgi:prevent-host-death family protein
LIRLIKGSPMPDFVSLYDAKTHLSRLVDRAAAGEEIVITKNGIPLAKLVAAPSTRAKRRPANALGITYISDDFDDPMPELERLFYESKIDPEDADADLEDGEGDTEGK